MVEIHGLAGEWKYRKRLPKKIRTEGWFSFYCTINLAFFGWVNRLRIQKTENKEFKRKELFILALLFLVPSEPLILVHSTGEFEDHVPLSVEHHRNGKSCFHRKRNRPRQTREPTTSTSKLWHICAVHLGTSPQGLPFLTRDFSSHIQWEDYGDSCSSVMPHWSCEPSCDWRQRDVWFRWYCDSRDNEGVSRMPSGLCCDWADFVELETTKREQLSFHSDKFVAKVVRWLAGRRASWGILETANRPEVVEQPHHLWISKRGWFDDFFVDERKK